MSELIDNFLSQYLCAKKKNKPAHKYSELKHIVASYLYSYAENFNLQPFFFFFHVSVG